MAYFIAINNCQANPLVLQSLDNEFEYPTMSAFYREKASGILDTVPSSIGLRVDGYSLGEYDRTKHAFPFVDELGNGKKSVVLSRLSLKGILTRSLVCRGATTYVPPTPAERAQFGGFVRHQQIVGGFSHQFNIKVAYSIAFDEIKFSELPLDEASARNYASSSDGRLDAFHRRTVTVNVDLEVLSNPPKIGEVQQGLYKDVEFSGRIKKITVVSALTGAPIGVLSQ